MRPLALSLLAMLIPVPPPVLADEREGSLWVGGSGLCARLSYDGSDQYVLRADHCDLFGDLFSTVRKGTVLLRAARLGDDLAGTAYVFSSGCTFSYQVRGGWKDDGRRLEWSGQEPKDRAPNTCRVTRTQWTTTTLRIKSAPPAPAQPKPPPPPGPVAKPTLPPQPVIPPPTAPVHVSLTLPTMITIAVSGIIAAPVVLFLLRLAYLKSLAVLADIRLTLAEKRAQIAAVLPASRKDEPSLTLSEITELLEVMNLDANVRTSILRIVAARIEEKS
jgi:hypothetical protein